MTAAAPRTSVEICIDCSDDERLSAFWAVVLDYEPTRRSADGWRELHDPAGGGPVVWFQPVPEPKTTKNRVHLDVYFTGEDAVTAKRDELVALGGTAVRRARDFWLMQDPEGNEFCLCWPLAHEGGGSAG